ncbi:Crp/Fnr family transcriptional regulator [Ferrimonas senticii]|uniref:Crp/Fnr family transcriptional regulator n=1 Tax=Ferrimonas senticii TaxID=394566 RepID=UPI0004094DC5|nr:helix-turn-helix domain-containing protein [Ferrimonas senticii]
MPANTSAMTQALKPTSEIHSLSQQLHKAQIPTVIVDELLKSAFGISLKRGDRFSPSLDEGVLIYVRSGCLLEVLTVSDELQCASSVWTSGYIQVCLANNRNRFQHHHNYYHCLFDAELLVINNATIERLLPQCPQLGNFVLARAAECLHLSHNMALLRSSLDKRQNIILRLLILHIRTNGDRLKLTIDDLCLLSNTTRQYCSEVVKQLHSSGLIDKGYGYLSIKQPQALQQQIPAEVLQFLSHYMSLKKPR